MFYYIHYISVGPINFHQDKGNTIFSTLNQTIFLTFATLAYPKPSSINCTAENVEIKQSVENETDIGTRLPKSLVSLHNDLYEFTITVHLSGPESFGEYTCSISNGIGEPLFITYTIKEQVGKH